MWGDLTTKDRHEGMQANVFSIMHYCRLFLPPQFHAMHIPAKSNQNIELAEEYILK